MYLSKHRSFIINTTIGLCFIHKIKTCLGIGNVISWIYILFLIIIQIKTYHTVGRIMPTSKPLPVKPLSDIMIPYSLWLFFFLANSFDCLNFTHQPSIRFHKYCLLRPQFMFNEYNVGPLHTRRSYRKVSRRVWPALQFRLNHISLGWLYFGYPVHFV